MTNTQPTCQMSIRVVCRSYEGEFVINRTHEEIDRPQPNNQTPILTNIPTLKDK